LSRTYSFVKKTGRDKHWDVLAKELAQILDKNGTIPSRYLREVSCVVCESPSYLPAFKKEGFQFVKCTGCGLLYVNPQLDPAQLIDHYRSGLSSDSWVEVLMSEEEQRWSRENKFGRVIKDLNTLFPPRGKILDIGCSIGLFLKMAKDEGWQPFGLEINTKAVAYAKEHFGLEIEGKLLHEVDYPDKCFTVISMWGVLEHLAEPRSVLAHVYRLLDDNGVFVVFVPNGHSLSTRIMHEHSSTFSGRNHLWYFTPHTLTRFLESQGFEVFDYYTLLSQLEEITHFLRYQDPYLSKGDKADEFELPHGLEHTIEDFILTHHLGYKLVAYARKKP